MPFVQPPSDHPWNYWIMCKRVVSVPFVWFGTGLAAVCLACFVVLTDGCNVRCDLFRRFGQNALLAYVIHHLVLVALHPLIPQDAVWWYVLLGFGLFFVTTDAFVRYLERNQVFLRL